jgi:signal peptide peptidase SppA
VNVTMLLRDRVMAVCEETWPAYRAAYLEAKAHPPVAYDPTARIERPAPKPQGGIAVVPIMGALSRRGDFFTDILGWATYEGIAEAVAQLAADRSIARIVLRVDSPGGTVFGVEDAAQAVADAAKRKPVVAIADGLMASAAYWVASGATEIIATPGSELGSIGVIAVHTDVSGALAQEGVVATELKAGKHKGEGSPLRPLSDDDRAALEERIEAQYQLFTARVARGRKVSVEDVRAGFGEGRVLTAQAAVKAGLANRIARMGDVIEASLEEITTNSRASAKDADLRLKARHLALCGD